MPLTMRMDPAVPPPPDFRSDDAPTAGRGPSSPAGGSGARARRCPTCQTAFSGEARFCPFDGDALLEAPDWNPAADPLIGQVVDGRYEVSGVLGEGGMGTVYEVRHTSLGRRFALKVLRRDIADAEHTARFIQEAKAAAAIGHPNIVAVSDFGEIAVPGEGGQKGPPVPYFVMEHLHGISLAALLRAENTLDAVRAAQIVVQCAAGLAAAHAAGVIHRDLKPDNVFLTRSGDREFVKLLDFGVAKMVGAGRLTRAGMVFGTPHYMSPEQAAGQGVDNRSDIYALGVILYECLAGHVPFEADTYMGVLTKHMFATPEPIERLVPDASRLGALGSIVMRCLAKNPQERFASMGELVAALEQAIEAASRATPSSRRPAGRRARASVTPGGTPGLRPVVGPLGVGLGVVALACVGLLVAREGRGPQGEAVAAKSAASAVEASPTAAVTAPIPTVTAAPTASVAATTAPTAATAVTPASTPPRPRPGGKAGPEPRKPRGSGDVVDPWGR